MDKKEDKQVWCLSVLIVANGANVNGVLAQELHDPEIKCLKIKKVYDNNRFKYNIWADLDEMGSLSSLNRGVN